MESGLSVLSSIAKLANDKKSTDYFRLVLTFSDSYWPEIESRINFDSPDDVHGFSGFGEDLKKMCQIFKHIIRKEQIVVF